MPFIVTTFLFKDRLDPFQFRFCQMFDSDELVPRRGYGADQFIDLGLNGRAVAILRILDQEDHEEGYDGRTGVDDQLPGVGIVKNRAGHDSAQYHHNSQNEGGGLA